MGPVRREGFALVGLLAWGLLPVGGVLVAEPPAGATIAPIAPDMPAPARATAIWPGRTDETLVLEDWSASQGVVADGAYLYGISNRGVSRIDRATGAVLAVSPDTYPAPGDAAGPSDGGPAVRRLIHLNAGLPAGGRLYLFHSNYVSPPDRPWSGPDEGEILACDLETLDLSVVHTFGDVGGSLTWAVPAGSTWPLAGDAMSGGVLGPGTEAASDDPVAPRGWICHFARYGEANDRSFLAWYDARWREVARWTYPTDLTDRLDRHSLSGGVVQWFGGRRTLLASPHHGEHAFRLTLPPGGGPLRLIGVERVPFDGQAFGADPITGGLVGIVREKKEIVFSGPRLPVWSRLRTARP